MTVSATTLAREPARLGISNSLSETRSHSGQKCTPARCADGTSSAPCGWRMTSHRPADAEHLAGVSSDSGLEQPLGPRRPIAASPSSPSGNRLAGRAEDPNGYRCSDPIQRRPRLNSPRQAVGSRCPEPHPGHRERTSSSGPIRADRQGRRARGPPVPASSPRAGRHLRLDGDRDGDVVDGPPDLDGGAGCVAWWWSAGRCCWW